MHMSMYMSVDSPEDGGEGAHVPSPFRGWPTGQRSTPAR